MDWTTLLRAQQADFIERLQSGCLLHCEKQGQHSELTVVSGKRLTQLRDFCWEMVRKYKPDDPRLCFINNMKGKLGEEVVKARLTNFVTEVDYEKRLGGDGKIDFTLTSDPSVGIQVKARHGSTDTVQWWISQEEVQKNVALVCILIQEEVNEAQAEFNLILAGFLPTSMIKFHNDKSAIKIDDLLYCGGVRTYLDNFREIKNSESLQQEISQTSQPKDQQNLRQNKNPYIECQIISLVIDYFILGNACYKQNDYQTAIANYDKALQFYPNLALAYFYRGTTNYKLGNIHRAIEDFNQAIMINPVDATFYLFRGNIFSVIGDIQNAINDFNLAIKINTKYETAYYIRANVRYKIADIQGAIEDYTQATLINPLSTKAYLKRGKILYKVGNKQDAIEDYNQVIRINSNYDIAYYNRSIARYEIGDKQGALEDYNYAIQINPNLPRLKRFATFKIENIKNSNSLESILEELEELNSGSEFEYFEEYEESNYTSYEEETDYTSTDYGYLEDVDEFYDYFHNIREI